MKSRLLAFTAVSGLVLALLVATAPAANAAWRTQHTIHRAKIQVCKVPTSGGHRVWVRVNNRAGRHAHTGALYRSRGGRAVEVQVRAAAGRISQAKAIAVRRGDFLQTGAGEGAGIGMGDVLMIGRVPRC